MRALFFFLLAMTAYPTWAWQEAKEELPDEVLKDDRLELTGWVDLLYRNNNRPQTEPFFNFGHAYLGISYRITPNWRTFVELEYEREPPYGDDEAEDEFKLDRAYLEYRRSAAARLRIGKVNTPAGIWKPEHWALTVDTIEAPIMEDNGFIPIKSEGLEFSGIRTLAHGELNYTVIGAYVDDEEAREHNLEDASALGGDLHLHLRERYMVGLSVYSYTDPNGTGESSVGILPYFDLGLIQGRLSWRSEWLSLRRDDGDNVDSYYSQLKFHFNPMTYLNLRHDEGDDERRAGGRRHRANALTLAWWARANWRFKCEYERHEFNGDQIADFDQWSLWTGYIFK